MTEYLIVLMVQMNMIVLSAILMNIVAKVVLVFLKILVAMVVKIATMVLTSFIVVCALCVLFAFCIINHFASFRYVKYHCVVSICYDHILRSIVSNCPADTFRCGDGLCLDSRRQCDGYPDCQDGSDEFGCGIGTTPSSTSRCSLSFYVKYYFENWVSSTFVCSKY